MDEIKGFLYIMESTSLILIILKLTNHIAWSWWWVFAPMWIPVALFVLLIVFGWIIDRIDN